LGLDRAPKPFGRGFGAPAILLRQPELNDRGHVLRTVGEQLLELGRSLLVRAENRIGASQLPAGVAVVGRLAQPLLQLRHAPVVVTGIVISDFEVALRDLHLRVQLERARERREDRKSTRLNSSHVEISYAVFCLKKKKK